MLYVENLQYVFSTNTAIEQGVIVLTVVIANFIVFKYFWYTPLHLQSKLGSEFDLIHGLPK